MISRHYNKLIYIFANNFRTALVTENTFSVQVFTNVLVMCFFCLKFSTILISRKNILFSSPRQFCLYNLDSLLRKNFFKEVWFIKLFVMKVFMYVFDILKTHKTLSLLKNVEIHQYLCNVVPYLEIEVNFCLFPMCSGPDNCHFQLHLKLTFLHAGMCVNNRKSSGFLVSVFKHSTLMCHEGTFVWQNPIQTINALLWFLEICRGNGGKLLNHQSLNQFSGRVSWLCACTHVFLCLNQSCIFPQNHWITLLQVQTNSTSVNDCQILPLLLSGFTANTVIFFLCFSVRHICVGKCFLEVW